MRDFEVEHEKPMHLIIGRRDLAGFQHLHPALGPEGTWRVPVSIQQAGSYLLLLQFKHQDRIHTVAFTSDVRVARATATHMKSG